MLDVTTKNATRLKVTFPKALGSDAYVATRVRVVQAPGAHDIALVSLASATRYDGLLGGAPISVEWTNPRGSGLFAGYVHRMDPKYVPGDYRSTLICVGSSYPLMNHGTDVWVGVTAADVVRDVAFKHGLDADVEEHPRVYGQVAQAGQSYWQLLVRLADETGYVLRMEAGTLVFRSRSSLNTHFRPIAPVLDFVKSREPQLKNLGEITEFKPMVGAYTPELGATRASRTAYGVSPKTGEVITKTADLSTFQASDDPIFTEALVGHVINNEVEATTVTQAAQERNRFSTVAKMETLGDPYLAPERVVYLRGLDPAFAGYWTVRKVEHDITPKNYRCHVEVGTDGLGAVQPQTGEPSLAPAPSSVKATVNPHRPGALRRWPYPAPVLQGSQSVLGTPGQALADFYWTAPVSRWRSA